MNKNYSPIFIIAPVRSGSTFLRLMLDSHPNIVNPGECDFLFDLVSDNGKYPMTNVYHEWLTFNRIFQAKNINIDKELSYSELMDSFIEQLKQDNSVLSMNVHRHFHRIPKVFSNARYIHLLRDPRDVARSCIGMGWVGNVYYGIDIWVEAEKSWDLLKKTLKPNQFIEIKYEDLLDDIEKGLTAICEFHGVEYSESMLNYAKTSTYKLPNKNLSYQWKKKYSKRELQLVEGKVSKMLLERGYELSGYSPEKPNFFERVVLLIQNKIFCVQYKIKKYGLNLYVKNVVANRIGINSWKNECKRRISEINIKWLK